MLKICLPAIAAACLAVAAPAQAAVLSFDLSGLEDSFGILNPVKGGFTLDTDAYNISGANVATDLDTYANGSVIDGLGFGLPAKFFFFQTAMTSFFFGIDGFDLGQTGLAVGESRSFDQTFAFESDEVTPDYQIGLDGRFAGYFGTVGVTRLADAVAPVPLPASLPLLIAALLGFGFLVKRPKRAVA